MASEHDSGPEPRPSKTRRKKEMHALQALGEQLTTLSSARLERLDLPPQLLEAIREYQRLPNRHGARRRQRQYIGRLMRATDHESLRRQLEGDAASDNFQS